MRSSSRRGALADAVRGHDVDRVVLIARGSSDHAAIYGRYLLEGRCGIVTALAAPSLYTTYARPSTCAGRSRSASRSRARRPRSCRPSRMPASRGALTAAVTNEDGSSIARGVDHPLLTRAGTEQSVAATKTYTAQLAAFAALAAALGARALCDGLGALPGLMSDTLAGSEAAAGEAALSLARDDAAVCVARGFSYAVALEAALKLKETCGIWAEGFSSADLRHGPTAAVTRATPALVFHAGGALESDVEQLEGELRARGAPLISIGPGRVVPTAEPPCEELAPFTLVLPAQLIAERLARLRGRDPDRPSGLQKVTETF